MREWFGIRSLTGAWCVALGCLLILAKETDTGDHLGGLLFGFAALAGGVMLLSGSLTAWAARPFTRLVDLVYSGNNDREPPPLHLRLPQAYRTDARYAEAIAEYERQLEYHPRSAVLWTEMIRTACEAGDLNQARRFLHKALRRVDRGARRQLAREFSTL